MDVQHNVTDEDRQYANAEEALRKRQLAEDQETRRVRGPQRPADQLQAESLVVPAIESPAPPEPPETV